MRSATEEGLSTDEGAPSQRLIDLTAELARGGTGLIIAGSAFISREGRYDTAETGMDRDALLGPLSRMCDAVHRAGGILAAQKAGLYGPSAVAMDPACDAPVLALTKHQIGAIVDDYARAASRARRAGFDAVQILAARWRDGDLTPATCISCNKCLDLVGDGRGLGCIFHKDVRGRAVTKA